MTADTLVAGMCILSLGTFLGALALAWWLDRTHPERELDAYEVWPEDEEHLPGDGSG